MRTGIAIYAAVLTAVPAFPAISDPTSGPVNPEVALYPADALAAGLDGKATIKCHRDQHAALIDCVVVSESPSGHGFGAAAVAIATNAGPKPAANLSSDEMALALPFQFTFTAKPPSVQPDLYHEKIGLPHWLTRPNGDDMSEAYPDHALRTGVAGMTSMDCRVDEKGDMSDCQLVSETPAGQGFGEAALKLSRYFKMTTFTDDGIPTVGTRVRIPIRWMPPQQ